jgi:hypothetical protein
MEFYETRILLHAENNQRPNKAGEHLEQVSEKRHGAFILRKGSAAARAGCCLPLDSSAFCCVVLLLQRVDLFRAYNQFNLQAEQRGAP